MSTRRILLSCVVAGSVLVGLGRLTVPGRPASAFTWALSYEAVAHVWFALLAGAGGILLLAAKDRLTPDDAARLWRPTLIAAAALFLWEIAAFAAGYWLR